jgi:hypothetical protein
MSYCFIQSNIQFRIFSFVDHELEFDYKVNYSQQNDKLQDEALQIRVVRHCASVREQKYEQEGTV